MARAVQQARRLRRTATRHEKRLWWQLRDRKLGGLKFRRQVPIGNRVIDFFCAEAHLAIELDGSGHCGYFTQTDDLDRAIELHEKGIRIIRFYNSEIDNNLAGILNAILYAADPERSLWPSGYDERDTKKFGPPQDPHLSPLPQGEEV
jgi:very-short-patch-repair endonuclease